MVINFTKNKFREIRIFNLVFRILEPDRSYWNRLDEDSTIRVLYGDCKFQYDNSKPMDVIRFKSYEIPKYVFYRLTSEKHILVLMKKSTNGR
jgi:hypothetical protein